jgi:hypothetical protein
VGLAQTKTVQAKLRLEQEAAAIGVHVRSYYTDNDGYTLKEFSAKLASKGQGIKHSGVGGHQHDGVAESWIKHIIQTGRTIMIYAALYWEEHKHCSLWAPTLSYAIYLHNKIPSQRGWAQRPRLTFQILLSN